MPILNLRWLRWSKKRGDNIEMLLGVKVRGPGKTASEERVNMNLLDELERALATFQNESYKFIECVGASFLPCLFGYFFD
jgi:hypothetical protein